MMKPFSLFFCLLLGTFLPLRAQDPLHISFENASEFATGDVYFWFVASGPFDLRLGGTETQVELRRPYTFSELQGGLDARMVTGGRIYVSLGEPLPAAPAGDPVDPGILEGNIGANIRHDFIEFTYNGNPGDVADITSMDQFAIPLSLGLKKNGVALSGPDTAAGWKGHTDAQIVQALKAQAAASDEVIVTHDNHFIRVKGATKFPTLYHNTPEDAQSMTAYLAAIANANTPLVIKGVFLGETYVYEAKIDEHGNYEITRQAGSEAAGPNTIVIPASYTEGGVTVSLAEAIYLSNPHYSMDGGPLTPTQNDLAGAVARDLFAALNLGYVNSAHVVEIGNLVLPPGVDPEGIVGRTIGQLSTEEMHYLNLAFDDVNSFYNIYANEIRHLSDSYGYAYSDWNSHLSKVAVLLAAEHDGVRADELTITISGSRDPLLIGYPGGPAVPEPSTVALLAALAGLWGASTLRRRRGE